MLPIDTKDIDVVYMEIPGHSFLFTYRSGRENEILHAVADQAADPENPLDWNHAALINRHVRANAERRARNPNR